MTERNELLRTSRNAVLFAFALGLSFYLAWLIRDVLVLLYIAALFAVVLTPVVEAIAQLRFGSRQPFKRSALLVLMLLVVAVAALFAALALPPVVRDLQGFLQDVPARLPVLAQRMKSLPIFAQLDAAAVAAKLQEMLSPAAGYLLNSLGTWAGRLSNIVMGIILTVYFITDGERAYNWCLSFLPIEPRQRLDATLRRADVRMGKWLLGQGSLMLILGVCSTIAFLLLKVRYAYALGVLAFAMNLIPVVGIAVTIIAAAFAAALDSWYSAIGVIVFFAVYMQIENSILIPRIMQKQVGLPGLAVIVALLLGFSLAGIVGAMVSVPTAVLVSVLLDEYLVARDGQSAPAP